MGVFSLPVHPLLDIREVRPSEAIYSALDPEQSQQIYEGSLWEEIDSGSERTLPESIPSYSEACDIDHDAGSLSNMTNSEILRD
jgi:hypothetical protein